MISNNIVYLFGEVYLSGQPIEKADLSTIGYVARAALRWDYGLDPACATACAIELAPTRFS